MFKFQSCFRSATFALAGTLLSAVAAQAAPQTLSFNVSARFAARDARDGSLAAEQSLDARVSAKGNRARVETSFSDRPVVLILAPPYVYRLLPQAKAGVRYRVGEGASNQLTAANIAAFLRDPKELRAILKRGGAKQSGAQVVAGQRLEVWTATQFAGRPAQVKAWLRPSDALPARLQVSSKTVSLSASWRDYKKGAPLPDTLFSVPSGFKVREAADNVSPL